MTNDAQKAKDYAFLLLTTRPRTCQEIRTKLSQKGFTGSLIDEVVQMLLEYKYLDDWQFARMWIKDRCQLNPMGKWRLKQELKLKGISNDIIEAELSVLTGAEELIMASDLAAKKLKNKQYTPKQLFNFLTRRGFSLEIIKQVIDSMV